MVRSPDGESRSYSLGGLTIQRASAWVLERYYVDFPIYNPYLDRVGSTNGGNANASTVGAKRRGNLKYYDIDGYDIAEEKVSGRELLLSAVFKLCWY